MHTIDEFDRAILNLLQKNNKLTSLEISFEVGLSQSAVQRRIKRLRKNNVIKADISIIRPESVGLEITCIVDVILCEGNTKAINDFKKSMSKCKEVAHCYYVTGSYDFVLIIQAKNMAHFEEFQKNYLMDNLNLKHFYTHVVMDKVKENYNIPF